MTDCLFCKIIAGELPSRKVYEDDKLLAFRDIKPQAPVHVIVIPKTHIASVDKVTEENVSLVAEVFKKIPAIAAGEGLTNGYRIVTNVGPDARQSVEHMHFHIIGGRQMADQMV